MFLFERFCLLNWQLNIGNFKHKNSIYVLFFTFTIYHKANKLTTYSMVNPVWLIRCNKCTNNNNKDNNNSTTAQPHTLNNIRSPLQGHHAFHAHIHKSSCVHHTSRFVVVHQHSNNTKNTFSPGGT